MRIVVAGAHGKIAMLLHPLLKVQGHQVLGLIRNINQSEEVRQAGAEPVHCDLETEDDVAAAIASADAIVFAAGAGPRSGAARKLSMDRDGAIKLISAAQRIDVPRYVMISAMGAEAPRGEEVFQTYLRAKSEADQMLRGSGLDFTIVRPGRLTNDPGRGRIQLGTDLPKGQIPRADVAAVIACVLQTPATIGCQFELTSGEQPISDAVALAADSCRCPPPS